MGNLQVRLGDQKREVWTVGDRPTEVKVRSLVAWIAGRREIEFPKPIDKAIFRMVSKSSGRNESERRCGLESEKPQGLSFQLEMRIACKVGSGWLSAEVSLLGISIQTMLDNSRLVGHPSITD